MPTQRRAYLFPVTALGTVFRSTYLGALQRTSTEDGLQCAGSTAPWRAAKAFQRFRAPLWQPPWVV